MMKLLGDLPYVNEYLNDILITTNDTYKDHLHKLKLVLTRLNKKKDLALN